MKRPFMILGLALSASIAWGLEPSYEDSVAAEVAVRVLESAHYSHPRVDETVSRDFLKNYIESYDPEHMFFTRSDVEGLQARYGSSLATRARRGDLTPAYEVYNLFMRRLEERLSLAHTLLASTFTFTADESIPADRADEPWPADEQEAREAWRLSVKSALLHARLDKQAPADLAARYESLRDAYKDFSAEDVLQNFLDSLYRVFDPHSGYFAPSREENFRIEMRLSVFGIGAVLRSEAGRTKIVSIVPGGPADKDKRLKPNDAIEAVAQGDEPFVEVTGRRLDRVVALIRGAKGTVVRLRVIPSDALDPSTRVTIVLTRDEVSLRDREAKAKRFLWKGPDQKVRKLGLIDLPSFYSDMEAGRSGKSTTRDVEALLGGLERKGIEGLVLDLRGNAGGALNEAVDLTSLFIGKGPVVQVRDGRGDVRVLEARGSRAPYGGPLVVLTSHGSASASEILAAALQEHGRAVVVGGKTTFGKGTVQTVLPLDRFLMSGQGPGRLGSVHLTVQKFYRVSGGSTQSRGVAPDVRLPSMEDCVDRTESSLPHSLPYDEIAPAASTRTLRLDGILAASSARVASSPEFAYLREDVEECARRTKRKRMSLRESDLLAEKTADDEREQKRKKDRLPRGTVEDDAVELTLEALDGAPKPLPAAEPPKVSTGTYEKAPPRRDVELDESLNILSDMLKGR